MKRIKVASALAGAALVALAGSANAMDINIYGASAQFNFWKNAAAAYLGAAPLSCAPVTTVTCTSKDLLITGTNCTANAAGNGTDTTINIRVSNKASFDGIFAVTSSNDSTNGRVTTCDPALNARPMCEAGGTLACETVTIGASDVPANGFVQTSNGTLIGPLGGAATARGFSDALGNPGIPVAGVAATYNPVKVPFGFFVTSNIQVQTCTAGPTIGDYCNTNEDCGTGGTCSAPRAIAVTDNITREMATQLFSNTLTGHNWNAFAGFSSLPQVACVRHAGSGSHATIDLGLMNSAWGKGWPTSSRANQFWFNDGTGDLLNCMKEVQATTKSSGSTSTVVGGAIGYADADTAISSYGGAIIGPLKYNGNYPNSQNIKSGNYDLYADQTLYLAPTAIVAGASGTTQKNFIDSLMCYLNDATGSHLNTPGYNFRNFWAASAEMQVGRGTPPSPFKYPYRGGQDNVACH